MRRQGRIARIVIHRIHAVIISPNPNAYSLFSDTIAE
jgi:hypothetical protein